MASRTTSSSSSTSNNSNTEIRNGMAISDADAQPRLDMIRRYVAKPIPTDSSWKDPEPALLPNSNILIGNKHHAANVSRLLSLGVTAVLNCASGGISRLPVDELKESGIRYAFTNVRQDNYTYPILHDHTTGQCSKHLEVAKALYGDVVYNSRTSTNTTTSTGTSGGGKVLFFCVAGQNRSATLAIAVLMLFGHTLESMLESCAKTRPFILENIGFQRQLVELEAKLMRIARKRMLNSDDQIIKYSYGKLSTIDSTVSDDVEFIEGATATKEECVEIELLIPGYCTMEVMIPVESTVATVKQCLIDHANKHLLSYENDTKTSKPRDSSSSSFVTKKIAKSWVVLAMFGYDDMYDVPLEVEATELSAQLERMKKMFGLTVTKEHPPGQQHIVRWNEKCRFALVIFSVYVKLKDGSTTQEPWKFVHEERPGAPATLLENTLFSTHLRSWDFVTGQAFCSKEPVVFSFADDSRDKRAFMKISTSANEAQQFHAPGEGGILGMGSNAIVHRVQLKPTSADPDNEDESSELSGEEGWDAAVKRPFSLSKMLASLENSSEAGLAKRMRFANSLNSDGRVLYFYGLGVGLAANAMNQTEYKFEATLLARYEEEFSSYTMRRFMEDYIAYPPSPVDDRKQQKDGMMTTDISTGNDGDRNLVHLHSDFSLISVKVLLVSLLNAFRDLTLMGICAFDFNHLNNVLVSHDLRTVRLIDIDGNAQGSIQYPSEYMDGYPRRQAYNKKKSDMPHKPSLDIDLNTVLPSVVQKLLLGKGRGPSFVSNKIGDIWRAPPDTAKAMIREVIRKNFFASTLSSTTTTNSDNLTNNHGDFDNGSPGLHQDLTSRTPLPTSSTTTTSVTTTAVASTSTTNLEDVDEDTVMEDFTSLDDSKTSKHIAKVAEWFYAVLKKQSPWDNWTNDIYDAMRCIDHLPIT